MKEIMIATTNKGKVKEFMRMLEPLGYQVKSLLDFEEVMDIEENGTTFAENALIKARAVYDLLHIPVISDDSGLAINHLDGAPGIYSARYLGKDTSYEYKNNYIIEQLKAAQDRRCQYICAIAYIDEQGKEHIFEGVMHGLIAYEPIGDKGFGYDPIFYYEPFSTTLANVPEELKNSESHRGLALAKLIAYMEGK